MGRLFALLTLSVVTLFGPAPGALAARNMQSIIQDDPHLEADPSAVLAQARMLGATTIKVWARWYLIAPHFKSRKRPRGFKAADPAAYPASSWAVYDEIVRQATAEGFTVDLDLGEGAPVWATGPGAPKDKPYYNWEPSPAEFGLFVKAVGTRYSGHYVPRGSTTPLPKVSVWSVWNEPNLGFELAPQGVGANHTIENSGRMYRALLSTAWRGLHETGHGKDTILIGELGPRGSTHFGVFAAMKPLIFMEALYCVDASDHPLRGFAAAIRGCPTTAAGSRRFRAQNPALFQASGLADHMWARWYTPVDDPQHDPNYAGLPDLPHFTRAVDAMQRAYGSIRRFPIYNTEFGYVTNPPNHSMPFVSPSTAAYYLNWAEYVSWRNPRIYDFDQYLLKDPMPDGHIPYNGWSAGLLDYHGKAKVTYAAWRMPLYLPVTSTRRSGSLEVWGCVRPAPFAISDTGLPQTAQIQYARGSSSSFTTIRKVTLTSTTNCYFDVHVSIPASGAVRLSWQYPSLDSQLGYFGPLKNRWVYSRSVKVTVR